MKEMGEVLVVGGGPVGLLAALCLNERDVRTRVVDADWERPVRSYACGLHPESSRLLDELGLLDRVVERAHRIDRLAIYRGSERVGSVDLNRLEGAFPHVLTLPQTELEEILFEALEQRDVEILSAHEVRGLALHDDFVEATVVSKHLVSQGSAKSRMEVAPLQPALLRAEWVVVADGHYSPCRTALGIDAINLEQSEAFGIFEFTADLARFEHEATVILAADSVSAFWPLGPSEGRWTFQLWKQLDQTASLSHLHALLDARAPWFDVAIDSLAWGTVIQFERLIASQFGRDRIWFAGDAAHTTGPLGFQSLNRGFAEAHELASSLAMIAREDVRRSDLLRRYDASQQSEWRRLLGIATTVASDGALSVAEASRLVPCLPVTGADLDGIMKQLGLRFV